MELVSYSTAPAPRYLFRTQLPSSRPIVDVYNIKAHGVAGSINLSKRLLESTNIEQWDLKKDLTDYIVEGNSHNKCAVAWTSSLMYALARARIMTHDFFKDDTGCGGRQMEFVEEDRIEIFVLDTSLFPPGTLISVWHPQETIPSAATDYVTSNLELPVGCCAQVTLRDLYEANLKTLLPPYRNIHFSRVRATINHIYVVTGDARDLQEYTNHIAQIAYNQSHHVHVPEEVALNAASEIARLFPATFEVPMFLAFLSLSTVPDASACYAKIKQDFGDADIGRSLGDLHLESITNRVWLPRFSQIAVGVKCRQEAEDLLALEETMRDTPFKEAGGEDNEMWM